MTNHKEAMKEMDDLLFCLEQYLRINNVSQQIQFQSLIWKRLKNNKWNICWISKSQHGEDPTPLEECSLETKIALSPLLGEFIHRFLQTRDGIIAKVKTLNKELRQGMENLTIPTDRNYYLDALDQEPPK